jgi:hypothetical protein
MFHNKPFKKDLTAFAKGGKVVKHVGKGAREQSSSGGFGSLTGGDAMARMANNYPKAPAGPAPTESMGGPALGSSPVPMGSRPPGAPTAMMPGGIGGGGGEEEE